MYIMNYVEIYVLTQITTKVGDWEVMIRDTFIPHIIKNPNFKGDFYS